MPDCVHGGEITQKLENCAAVFMSILKADTKRKDDSGSLTPWKREMWYIFQEI